MWVGRRNGKQKNIKKKFNKGELEEFMIVSPIVTTYNVFPYSYGPFLFNTLEPVCQESGRTDTPFLYELELRVSQEK